jgi:N-acetyltransferase
VDPNYFQQILQQDNIRLRPLQADDFEKLYAVASDPLIWEQHPNKDRYQRPVFETFFEGALLSKGAYVIEDATTGEAMGCSRFYGWELEPESRVNIGYTFIGRNFWGKGLNPILKKLMTEHAFGAVDNIYFYVGEDNMRSRIAVTRLGATIIDKQEITYYGETPKINVIFLLKKP